MLLEVMIAIVIIAVGLLGTLGMVLLAQRNASSSSYRTDATVLGYDLLEKIRANRTNFVADPSKYASVPTCATAASTSIPEQDLKSFACQLQSTLPQGSASIDYDNATRALRITIRWNDSRGTNTRSSLTPVFTLESAL